MKSADQQDNIGCPPIWKSDLVKAAGVLWILEGIRSLSGSPMSNSRPTADYVDDVYMYVLYKRQ